MYEQPQNVLDQIAIGNWVALHRIWADDDITFIKTPPKTLLDGYFVRRSDQRILEYTEIKNRDGEHTSYPTLKIDHRKITSGALVGLTGLAVQFSIIIRWATNGVVMRYKHMSDDRFPVHYWGRNKPRDAYDLDSVLAIPLTRFTTLGTLDAATMEELSHEDHSQTRE